MGKLKDWVDEDWVRIDSQGNIAGKCGTSKNKKNPDRCLPRSKANSLSKSERASTARKKKREGSKGKQVVSNTKAAKVLPDLSKRELATLIPLAVLVLCIGFYPGPLMEIMDASVAHLIQQFTGMERVEVSQLQLTP